MNTITHVIWAGILALGLSGTAQATLFDRGGGMIYDSDQDITWLQDANYAATSGYDADGRMDWDTAVAWAGGLNYGGYDDWRLPTVTDTGALGCDYAFGGTDCGYNVDTATGEMAYLFYDVLGNVGSFDTSGTPTGCSPNCLTSTGADGVSFVNFPDFAYWSETPFAPATSHAWSFTTQTGVQTAVAKYSEFYAWAVRSGDVTVVPEPSTALLLALGLAGLFGVTRRGRC